jgi:hypothetical protein
MARELTTKQQWVLDRIRSEPWETMKEISEASPKRTEPRWEGSSYIPPAVSYQEVVVAVNRLLNLDLIERAPGAPPYRHGPLPVADSDDPLEQAFALPAAEEPKQRKKP